MYSRSKLDSIHLMYFSLARESNIKINYIFRMYGIWLKCCYNVETFK